MKGTSNSFVGQKIPLKLKGQYYHMVRGLILAHGRDIEQLGKGGIKDDGSPDNSSLLE